MKLTLKYKSFDWWLWFTCLVGIVLALFKFNEGYNLIIGVSAFQVIYYWVREKGLFTFNSQVRIVYLLLALMGLIPVFGYYFYFALLFGTVMVVFFGRCSIAMVLRKMPWNREVYCDLENR